MLRILFFLILVFAFGLGFAWLADRPGDLVMTFGGYQYQVTLMVAAVILAAVVVAVMLSWWLVKSIWASPYTITRYFRVRRRDRGYQALSTGMIAAGAGDAVLARKKKKEAMKLISSDQEPLIHLLDAQASLLEGDHEAARAKFEAMLADPETRLLGLRGLYLEAERLGDRAAARHYAAQAAHNAPQIGWAAEATLEAKTEERAWDEALRLVEAQKATGQMAGSGASRRKAVLLTAKAGDLLEADPAAAKSAASEANKLDPSLVPAALVAARAAFRLGDVRKGAKLLEAIWKKEPHPDVADLYVHARPGDSTHDRLDRAKKLQAMKLNHAESALIVAKAALDAGEYRLARREAESAIRLGAREGMYLLMADIEEAETGDQGKIRQWLSMAVRAPRDPAWVADGYVAEQWAPISPVTGRLDAFEWRAPSEKLGQLVDANDRPPERSVIPALPSTPPLSSALPASGATPRVTPVEPERSSSEAAPVAKPVVVAPVPVPDAVPPEEEADDLPARLPDDPGVDRDDEAEDEGTDDRRFKLF